MDKILYVMHVMSLYVCVNADKYLVNFENVYNKEIINNVIVLYVSS